MITVNGQVYLADVGGDERVYEGIAANVSVTFTKGKAILGPEITFGVDEAQFIKSVGSTVAHWCHEIRDDFENSGDYVLDHIVEDLEIAEYGKAETYITAYYQDRPMPDAVEVPLQKIEEAWEEHLYVQEAYEESEDED